MLRYLSAGESHGKCLTGVLEGLPAGLPIDTSFIDAQLRRRQLGYGRGARMRIESDRVEFLAGVRHGRTVGSPICFRIANKDWENWRTAMDAAPVPEGSDIRRVVRARPGHVDLAGALKFQTHDIRDVLERASARETAARVAAGAVCRLMLGRLGIDIGSHVLAIGQAAAGEPFGRLSAERILALDPESPVRCADPEAAARMQAAIDEARRAGDTVGGVVEVVAAGVPPGLGSHAQWDRRLDGLLAQALMSIPAAKAVEIGSGVSAAGARGSEVHDEIRYDRETRRFLRPTNRSGGIEGGISNGADIRARVYIKPIPTLARPLPSVDIDTKEAAAAAYERSDVCVVPAAAVVAEAMLALVLAGAVLEKFGGDSLAETEANFANFRNMLDRF